MNSTQVYESLDGSRVKAARKARGLTQTVLADAIEISQSNISFIEASRHNSAIETVEKLCEVLGVSEEWLSGLSNEGGVPLNTNTPEVKEEEKAGIGRRFVSTYERLKTLGVIETDAEFCEFADIQPSSLSLALAGKSNVPLSWIPFLEEKGGNREYIYNDKMPIIKLSKTKRIKDVDDLTKNIQQLINNIDADITQLKFLLKQII
jgi:transcriptional regulator with XRE-family HTH domain